MDSAFLAMVLRFILVVGVALLFLARKRIGDIQNFFYRLPRQYQVSAIIGAVLFLPISLIVGYFEVWLASDAICELGEWIAKTLDKPIIAVFGRLLGALFCTVGVVVGATLGFFGGFALIEILGAGIVVLITFGILRLWSAIQ